MRELIKNFIKIKYAVLFTMIFKLLKYGFVEEAYLFWLKLRDFHKKEFPCLPFIPWCLFVMMARVEFLRKRFKRAVKRFLL
ncbi:hypothetical protein TcarDRAFT_2736 [Thermosinus carboxydivorans Nor1]|uniref:Uncharacterized protein n=1 Tax=Thermosinus carboxydivorans Nor1 TaxID=401526 RepID=A1HMC9_9FIRM|nr:hypothetical protein TcarDRAFT_2736 [Thermosinus carboxydivorans Nor1]